MTIVNGFKLDYQRPQPRIVKLDAVKQANMVLMKRGSNRRSVQR